jgi:CYTH domain-containing protein
VIDRTAGDGRYAQLEREQRWVLGALPSGCAHPVSIVDRYISGTRLRLRQMVSDGTTVYKLAQKVRLDPQAPETVKLTNMYLSKSEYDILAVLDGAEIEKTRWRWTPGERAMAVDEFGGKLAGLILAEVELASGEDRWPDPPLAVAHVTDDDRFSGGTLAATTTAQITTLLVGLGVTAP